MNNFENIIINYFKENSKMTKLSISGNMKHFINDIDINVINYLNDILKNVPEYENIKNIIFHIIFNDELSKCKTCGKLIKFSKRCHSFCSNRCIGLNKDIQIAKNNTSLKNYGVKNPNELQIIKDKIRKTCLEKYGVNSILKLDHVRENNRKIQIENKEIINDKRKQTCLEKYGVDNYSKTDECKNKVKNTCLEKYGTSSYLNSNECRNSLLNKIEQHIDEINDKRKQTCLEKYGVVNPLKNDDIKNKSQQTCLEKYGVDNYSKTDEYKNKVKNTCLERYGKEYFKIYDSWNHLNSLEYVKPLFTFDEFKGGNKIEYKWKCTKCGHEFYSRYDDGHVTNRCSKCLENEHYFSYIEKELADFCKQYFPNLKENDRTLIKPLELDIVIEELKLAIEFNGSFWHDVNHKFKHYHLNKVLKCNQQGYRLIHIWEDEWNEQIKQKLIDIFKGKETIDYNQKLDRSWYNNLDGDFEESQPEIIIRNGFEVENCGYLIKKG